jgi:hypothetical protein
LGSTYYDDSDEEIPGLQRVGSYVAPSYAETFDSTRELLNEVGLTTDNEDLNDEIENCFHTDEWIQSNPTRMAVGQELSFMWHQFEKMVKHQQRFTFLNRPEYRGEEPTNDNGLFDILTELGEIISKFNLCVGIEPGTELYRCRFLDSEEVVDTFDKITSPPDFKAKQSRMSPAGISMFYGAFDKDTAVKESSLDGRSVDGRFVVGKFRSKRKLKVLDLTSLPLPSFWMPSDWQSLDFLHSFSREIKKKIDRDDRIHVDYVPSQVFTEYLRHIYRQPDGGIIDGIIFGSSLFRTGKNIVLFYDQRSSADILNLEEFLRS